MPDLFSPAKAETQERNWTPFIIGLVAVLVVVGIIAVVTRSKNQSTTEVNPYADKLKISDARVSQAENYVGGTVTYLDATVTNTGDKQLAGADMYLVFKNTMDQIVQKETLPVHVIVPNPLAGYPDLLDLSRSPIGPGQSKVVRMTLEHISADWNQAAPEMQLVNLKLKG
jgi:hypothetical protein